jgi:eukaryotic-like serine/threonine-protein kinase
VRAYDLPLEQVTTVSLEALKTYSIGVDELTRGEENKAILLFAHAVELDPAFAMAYAQLGIEYNNLGESEKAAVYLRKAYALLDHLTEREKFFLAIRYDTVVTGDTNKATQTAEMWTQIYPRDWRPFNTLSARYQVTGEYGKAAAAAEQALRLQPDHYLPYANLARSYLALGRFDDARRIAESAQAKHRDSLDTHEVLFDLAFIRHDTHALQREHLWGLASSRSNDMLSREGFAQAASGHLRSALNILRLSWDADDRSGKKEDEAYSMASTAVLQADFGELLEARSQAEEALKLGHGMDTEETAAQALALSGGGVHARLLASDLRRRFPLHVPFNLAALPTVLGSIEITSGHPARAVQILADAVPYDLCEFVSLGPVYIRGLAFLKLGQGRQAAAEFQKLSTTRGLMSHRRAMR